ncbi:MAG: nitroreductase [Thermoleophilia bacterium]
MSEAIATRRSVNRVTERPVDRAVIQRLITAATWAPNHKLTQPWRFVVRTGAARTALGEAHADAVQRAKPGQDPQARAGLVALAHRAPVIIACIQVVDGDDPVVRREDRDAVAAAVQNLLLEAHHEGLGAVWRSGLFCDEEEVRAHLGLGPDDAIVAFVYLGYPDESAAPQPRRSPDDVTEWRDGA